MERTTTSSWFQLDNIASLAAANSGPYRYVHDLGASWLLAHHFGGGAACSWPRCHRTIFGDPAVVPFSLFYSSFPSPSPPRLPPHFLSFLYIYCCAGRAPRVMRLVSQTGIGGCAPPLRENFMIRRIVDSPCSPSWAPLGTPLCACGHDPLAATAALGSAGVIWRCSGRTSAVLSQVVPKAPLAGTLRRGLHPAFRRLWVV